jgi:hypothetical protein
VQLNVAMSVDARRNDWVRDFFARHGGPVLVMGMMSDPACAHVKWFASWDIICPPRDPMRVLTSPLWQVLFAACVVVVAALALLDWRLTRGGGHLQASRDAVHEAVIRKALLILRIGVSIYWMLTAFTLPDAVFLTPELVAPLWISGLQALCALLVLRESTAWLAGIGMIFMYVMAIIDYGWFHLLDYPLFLAIGIILVITRQRNEATEILALQILRWSAALTLLWGGIEKFAYPEWTFPLMQKMPLLSLGVSPETAMYMYGFSEVALSFGLLLFGVGSQVAALLLLFIFIGAIPPFGWVDLVGHSGVCVTLVLLTLVKPHRCLVLHKPVHSVGAHATLFTSTVAVLLAGYFGLHAFYLPTSTLSQFANQRSVPRGKPVAAVVVSTAR